jgi:SAM-dependent methyltransferase
VKDVRPDYYVRLHAVEGQHWWHVGMREIAAALLSERLAGGHLSLLDAGCGTGGFLAWADGTGSFDRLCGVDISGEAVELARQAVPSAELHAGPIDALPFDDASFDVTVLNDVLQHVEEDEVEAGLRELRRTLKPEGALLVRTNGGVHARRERSDWRLYDTGTLRSALAGAGFRPVRVTHVNALLSLWSAARGRGPTAPTPTTCGIPTQAGATANAVGRGLLRLEASLLRHSRLSIPYGHTLLAVAVPGART